MLSIENLCIDTKENKSIIKNINLKIKPGEIHAIMGPNGSGKSTLFLTISGNNNYKIKSGNIIFKKKDISEMPINERALMGLFLSFQNPVEISGISNFDLLKNSINSIKKYKKLNELDILEIKKKINIYLEKLKIDKSFLDRCVNLSYSGGEKKKNEILQMMIIKPSLSILDEIDSGLDIDSLKIVSNVINDYHNKKTSLIIITHRQNILNYIKPNFVHIMIDGKLIKTGDYSLSKKIEKLGYEWLYNK